MAKDMTRAEKMLATASRTAIQEFHRDGEVMPDFFMENEFGIKTLVRWGTGFENNKNKDNVADTMRKALREYNARCYAFITEAWMVDGADLPDKGISAVSMQQKGLSLEGHPDRFEAITVSVEDRDTKETYQRYYRILRPEHGKPTLAPPKELSGKECYSIGRFANMFEDQK